MNDFLNSWQSMTLTIPTDPWWLAVVRNLQGERVQVVRGSCFMIAGTLRRSTATRLVHVDVCDGVTAFFDGNVIESITLRCGVPTITLKKEGNVE